jgi:large subunit ribosomal protein L3
MPGRMGNERVTTSNMKIVQVDQANNILYVSGAVPGARNGLVLIYGEGELKIAQPKVEEVKPAVEAKAEEVKPVAEAKVEKPIEVVKVAEPIKEEKNEPVEVKKEANKENKK